MFSYYFILSNSEWCENKNKLPQIMSQLKNRG